MKTPLTSKHSSQTASTGSVDSMAWSHAFRLQTSADIPTDFPFPSESEVWRDAIFIPSAGKDWRGRPLHPPRIYTLTDSRLSVYTHPAFGVRPYVLELENLVELGCYRGTLQGELQFHGTHDESGPLHYGPFQYHFIDPFLKVLRGLWLPPSNHESIPTLSKPWKAMDSRCHVGVHSELDEEERILQLCFQPTRTESQSRWLLSHRETKAARLLVLTDRRLIFVVEGHAERQEEYGLSVRSCPASRLQRVLKKEEHDFTVFHFVFERSVTWNLWVSDPEDESIHALLSVLEIDPKDI